MPTDREAACFEAGITLGSLFHQFVGTPVAPDTAASLERAMEESLRHQLAVRDVSVAIDGIEHNRFGFAWLDGSVLTAEVEAEVDGVRVTASLGDEDGYPMMRVDEIEDAG